MTLIKKSQSFFCLLAKTLFVERRLPDRMQKQIDFLDRTTFILASNKSSSLSNTFISFLCDFKMKPKGKTKSKIELYTKPKLENPDDISNQIIKLEKKINELIIDDTSEHKHLTIELIEEVIAEYIEYVSTALKNYGKYKPVFDYKEKSLKSRKPKTSFIKLVGSNSNHMFLHLFFSLAMQEISFRNKSPFVAPFLIIDQPSRTYYGDEKNPMKKLTIVMSLRLQKHSNC